MKAGRLDALLTYWPFAAKAEADGARHILDVADAVSALGIGAGVPYIGYTFSQHWAEQNPALIDGFIAASRRSRAILATSDAEWQRVKPMTGAADRRRARTAARLVQARGCQQDWGEPERHAAAQLFELLAKIGGPDTRGPDQAPFRQEPSGRSLGGPEPSVPHTTRTANAAGLRRGVPARLADRCGARAQSPAADCHIRARRDGAADRYRAHCHGTLRSPWVGSPPPSRCRCCWAADSASPWADSGGSICGSTIP